MDGVGVGTELAGRYRLEERLRSTSSSHFWRAVDTTLDRTVGVRLVAAETAEDAMDAARRAAVVDEPALLRVLDVAQEDGDGEPLTYVVTEFVEADSLADLVRRDGPLPAERVRALVGATAEVLARVAEAGLHHQALEPTSVLRTPGGELKLEGLGVDAAAEGRAGAPGEQAARADAVALVGLLYAGLTGRWPLDGQVEGLEPAPRDGGSPVPPGDLVTDVPNDLDTLCAVTFGQVDDGPRTPAEVVAELRPWGRGTGAAATAGGAAARPAEGPATEPLPAARTSQEAAGMRPAGRFPSRTAAAAAGVAAAGAAAAGTGRAPAQGEPPADRARDDRARDDQARDEAPDDQEQTAAISKADLFGQEQPASDDAPRTGDDWGAGHRAPAGSSDAGSSDGGSRDDGYDESYADGYDDGYDGDQTYADGYDEGDGYDETYAGGYDETYAGGYDDGYDEGGFDDDDDRGAKPDRRPMIALAVLAVFVVVGLVLALQAIGGIGGNRDDVSTEPTGGGSSPSASASTPAPSESAATGPVPQISGVRTLDPQGGDGENDETAPRAIDDDPSSFWRSSTYKSAEFGGLKDGLGMVVTLSGEASVSSVTAQVSGSGGVLEVRTAPGQGLEDSQVVGTATPGSGTVTVQLEEPVTTQNVILWWTQLPDVSGSYRIELADVTVQ